MFKFRTTLVLIQVCLVCSFQKPTFSLSWKNKQHYTSLNPIKCNKNQAATYCSEKNEGDSRNVKAETTKRIISFLASISVLSTNFNNIQNQPIHAVHAGVSSRNLKEEEQSVIQLFKKAVPSIVFINTFVAQRDIFSLDVLQVPQGTGSGIIWSKDGYVVTNFHVIRGSQYATVTVTSSDGTKRTNYRAQVKGYDPDKDIAVLKIDPLEEIIPISVGESSTLSVGQFSFAIGNPFGLDHSLTTGIISGVGREMKSPTGRPITNVIQTDAAINPGNSGGALLDSDGNLIGMNTSIYSPSGASAGIGFAIPVDTIKVIVESIIKTGRVTRAQIGISYLESGQAKSLGISKGVLVLEVPRDSTAKKAGLRGTSRLPTGYIELGDIIVGINDQEINNESDLFKNLDNYQPGEKIELKILRLNGSSGEFEEKTLPIILQQKEPVPPFVAAKADDIQY